LHGTFAKSPVSLRRIAVALAGIAVGLRVECIALPATPEVRHHDHARRPRARRDVDPQLPLALSLVVITRDAGAQLADCLDSRIRRESSWSIPAASIIL
jgi:hypothetical protein